MLHALFKFVLGMNHLIVSLFLLLSLVTAAPTSMDKKNKNLTPPNTPNSPSEVKKFFPVLDQDVPDAIKPKGPSLISGFTEVYDRVLKEIAKIVKSNRKAVNAKELSKNWGRKQRLVIEQIQMFFAETPYLETGMFRILLIGGLDIPTARLMAEQVSESCAGEWNAQAEFIERMGAYLEQELVWHFYMDLLTSIMP